ncbi:MAG: Lrp/AsnC family transcriptional regulator, partial [Gammaproteobacteria bacterium]|nr:Lrp/AsnC family transcriptional regulator [Gammaproteobacteria bacterium]
MKIDGTDEAIMAVLQRDGRLSNREVARRLEISEGQVRQRLRKLFNGGAIRFDAVTDGRAMGINFVAFVKVSVEPTALA